MQLEKNNYKILKTKKYIKNNSLFFIFNGHLNTKNWTSTQQNFFKLNLNSYKIYNNLTKTILRNSIYKNFNLMIHGSIIFVNFKNKKINLEMKNLLNYNKKFRLVCLKLNHKIYSLFQVKNIINFNLKQNISVFCTLLKRSLKMSIYRLKKI